MKHLSLTLISGVLIVWFAVMLEGCGKSQRVVDKDTYIVFRALRDSVESMKIYGYARSRYFKIVEGAITRDILGGMSFRRGSAQDSIVLMMELGRFRQEIQRFDGLREELHRLDTDVTRMDSLLPFIETADDLSLRFVGSQEMLTRQVKRLDTLFTGCFGKGWSLDSLPTQTPFSDGK